MTLRSRGDDTVKDQNKEGVGSRMDTHAGSNGVATAGKDDADAVARLLAELKAEGDALTASREVVSPSVGEAGSAPIVPTDAERKQKDTLVDDTR
jgi:hypothetical protein